MGKELERSRGEAETVGAALASAKAEVHRIASELDGVRERSKGSETNQRASMDRVEDAAGR